MPDTMNESQKMDAATQLSGERNRERIKQQKDSSPLVGGGMGLNMAGGGGRQARNEAKMASIQNKQATGQSLSPAEKIAAGGKMRADRFKKKKQDEEKKNKEKGSKEGEDSKERNLSLGRFIAFFFIAVNMDLWPAVVDLILGVGWLLTYALLPLVWFFYWYLIISVVPQSLKRKYWGRSALMTAAGLIPYVGEILPEWTATAIGAWLMYRWYQTGQVGLTDRTATTKVLVEGKGK